MEFANRDVNYFQDNKIIDGRYTDALAWVEKIRQELAEAKTELDYWQSL
jgi:hypothetical protein